jgi:hypothetical protein
VTDRQRLDKGYRETNDGRTTGENKCGKGDERCCEGYMGRIYIWAVRYDLSGGS